LTDYNPVSYRIPHPVSDFGIAIRIYTLWNSYEFILCETFHKVLESVVARINPDITGQYCKSVGYMMGMWAS